MAKRSWLSAPARVWWGSLPARIVASTLASSLIVLLLGGLLLVNQATKGVLDAKQQTAIAQASTSLNQMQQQLLEPDLSLAVLYERLNRLADQAAEYGNHYIIIEGTVSDLRSVGITADSVPAELREVVRGGDGMWVTPTLVRYSSNQKDEPGLVIGASLLVPISGDRYPTYFIFPLTTEVATLQALEQAVLSTGLLLMVALALISYMVARQIVRPIRRASQAAVRLASGQLDERLSVKGTDDLASLATSMNHMAQELEQHIGRLEHLSRVQQRFVADVSHELRTPLTTVKMASEMLYGARDEFDKATARTAELLQDELDRFEELLTDLLEISRFDAGVATLTLEEVDLADIVRTEAASYGAVAERVGTQIEVAATEPAVAELDQRRIRRIVRNLISNAIEHAEGRPIELRVASNESAVALTVRDHGVGFEAAQAEQVFDRFWRADPSRNRSMGGTGLGLSISLEDARLHRGWLTAWGRPGEGAQFSLTLPRRPTVVLEDSPLPLVPADGGTPVGAKGGAR